MKNQIFLKYYYKTSCKTKKRKENALTNSSKKKSKLASNISAIVDNVVTKKVTEYSYENVLVKQLTLVVCGMNSCSKLLHHIYKNNSNQSVYDGGFENKFGVAFCCPEYMILAMNTEDSKMSCNKKLSKESNKFIDTLEHVSSKKEV